MSYFEYNDVYFGYSKRDECVAGNKISLWAGQPGGAYRWNGGRKEHDYEDNFGRGALARRGYCDLMASVWMVCLRIRLWSVG